jgi:hypothetical protein
VILWIKEGERLEKGGGQYLAAMPRGSITDVSGRNRRASHRPATGSSGYVGKAMGHGRKSVDPSERGIRVPGWTGHVGRKEIELFL